MSSQNKTIYKILKAPQTVFTPGLIAQLVQGIDRRMIERMNYYVKTRLLKNPRKGIYAEKIQQTGNGLFHLYSLLHFPTVRIAEKRCHLPV